MADEEKKEEVAVNEKGDPVSVAKEPKAVNPEDELEEDFEEEIENDNEAPPEGE